MSSDGAHRPPRPRRVASAAAMAFFGFALAGYLWITVSQQRGPAPDRAPASFGLSLDPATDPSQVEIVDDLWLWVQELDAPDARAKLTVRLRVIGGQAASPAGAAYFVLPRPARIRTLWTASWQGPSLDPRHPDTEHRLDFDPQVAGLMPTTTVTAGISAGQQVTVEPDRASEPGAATARFVRVPFPPQWRQLQLSLDFAVPSALFSRPDRLGERAVAVEFGATAEAARATHRIRPVQDYASEEAVLRLELAYHLSLSEVRFESIPPPTDLSFGTLTWTETAAQDGLLRLDGYLVRENARYWLRQVDALALLLLGAVLGALIDRMATR